MKIKILESTKEDLKEGYYFYELKRKGVGSYFLEALSADIESIKIFSGVHEIYLGKYYRFLSKRFPLLYCKKYHRRICSY